MIKSQNVFDFKKMTCEPYCWIVLLTVILMPLASGAQVPDSVLAEWPEADPGDVESPKAIVEAAYEAISVPVGEDRDLERLRSLFLPKARLMPTGRHKGTSMYKIFTMEGFIEQAERQGDKKGFFEREVHREIQRFGDIAHVWSTYESRRSPDDQKPFERGINSFQLWHDGNRWWIVSIMWHSESDQVPIPDRYE